MSVVLTRAQKDGLSQINPLAKLVVALVSGIILVLSIDVVSAGLVVFFTLTLLPFTGMRAMEIGVRCVPILVSAAFAGVATALYGLDSGEVLWALGPVTVTEGSVLLAIAIVLRVLAIGAPGVLLFATTDPSDLADALIQLVRLPARFVLGALAALRLVSFLVDDWENLARARRARGVADRARVRSFFAQALTLLVLAVRRAGTLSIAMEARGFAGGMPRSVARVSILRKKDIWFMLCGVSVVVFAVAASVLSGYWRWVL